MAADGVCTICGDREPFHVHDGDRRIEDYFTVGRGMTEMDAARAWQARARDAERALSDARTVIGDFVEWFRQHDGKADDFGRLFEVIRAEKFLAKHPAPEPAIDSTAEDG